MPLEDLHNAVETARRRISEQEPYLGEIELRTRQVLIDPILRTLGWDVSDPDLVELEVHPKHAQGSKNERSDYALMADGVPVAVIEAKKLGTAFTTAMVRQVTNYAGDDGIRFAILTDGNHWRVYDLHLTGPIAERVVVDFTIDTDPTNKSAMLSLALWRPNLQSDQPNLESIFAEMVESLRNDLAEECKQGDCKGNVEDDPEDPFGKNGGTQSQGWVALSSTMLIDKSPIATRFTGGKENPVKSGRHLFQVVAEYLIKRNLIKDSDIPVKINPGSRYAINWEPVHENGTPFAAKRRVREDLWAEANYSVQDSARYSAKLLEQFGVASHLCEIRFE